MPPALGIPLLRAPGLHYQRGAAGRLYLNAWLPPASEAKACGVSGSHRNIGRTMYLCFLFQVGKPRLREGT